MSDSKKLLLIAFSVLIGVFAVGGDALGGNAAVTGAEYFSVEMSTGNYLVHSDSEAVLLIDDITYSVDYAPCDPTSACQFITDQDLPAGLTTSGGLGIGGVGPPAPSLSGPSYQSGGSTTNSGGSVSTFNVGASKRAFNEVGLQDSTDGSTGVIFDRFSFSTYGQTALASRREWASFVTSGFQIYTEGGTGGNWAMAAAAGGLGVGTSVSMPMTLFSTPSSGSRHYQSPHILGAGRRVYYKNLTNSTSMYGKAMIKGRVILSPATPPTVNTGVSVYTT